MEYILLSGAQHNGAKTSGSPCILAHICTAQIIERIVVSGAQTSGSPCIRAQISGEQMWRAQIGGGQISGAHTSEWSAT